ncbi:hypothetical protein BAT02nite_10200 [Bacillus atrophaeus]|nr:hypothetical protein BAT02nite_10200 [Bacillus atrophaeus]
MVGKKVWAKCGHVGNSGKYSLTVYVLLPFINCMSFLYINKFYDRKQGIL